MKTSFTWLDFIRERAPQIIDAHFKLCRLFWQKTQRSLYDDDGYYGVVALAESHVACDPVNVHVRSIDNKHSFALGLFRLCWGDDPLAKETYAYLHSNDLNLLKQFCFHLEKSAAQTEKRTVRLLSKQRTPLEAILLKSQYRKKNQKPYGYLYSIK